MGTGAAGDGPVEVPQEFRDIGYSGAFHLTLPVGDPDHPDPKAAAELAAKVPMLSPSTPGWMVLSVDVERATAVMVRRDADAVAEALTRRGDDRG